MGGCGSSRWGDYQRRCTVEECGCVADADTWTRAGIIKPGAQFVGRWLWHRSQRFAVVKVNTVDPARALRLTYQIGEALM